MTRYDTSGNVQLDVEDSGFTISATGSITDATFLRYLATADEQLAGDDPQSLLSQTQANEAIALLICHRIARKKGQSGKISLSIGKYSYSKKLASGLTSWMDEYRALLDSVQNAPVDLSSSTYTDGFTRDDKDMDSLSLDQSTPYDLDDEERDE